MNPQGLSEAEVAQSAKRFGSNAQPEEKSSRVALQLWGVVKEPMMLLLVMAAIISAALGDPLESGALLISVFLVILISLIQVRRTDKALASLKLMSTPKATVYRDGELRQVLSRDLVVGDVLLLTEGDRLPADCRILESSNFLVDESIMTGESVPVEKRVEDVGLSGTLAIRGHAIAVIVEVGATSQIGQIGQMLSGGDKRTILQREVDRIVKVVSIAALATALTVTLVYFFTRGDFLVGLLAGVAAAMALLPEELPIVLTIFFGVGALRMARSKVIVKNNPAIEMLGQIDVLCVDKTGTITLNELTLISKDPQILLFGSLASIPTSFDPIDRAFLKETSVPEGFTLIREFPLTDESLIFCQIWQDTKGAFLAAIKGAPERVIELCRLSGDERVTTEKDLREAARMGLRVLGVAKALVSQPVDSIASIENLDFEFVGLAVMKDPVRPGVSEALLELDKAGIRTVLITGDFPDTAVAIGQEIGLASASEAVLGEDLERLSAAEVSELVRNKNIFSRVKPLQKLLLVEELQRQGRVVAMTGDGVNDAPALNAADVGIAMGIRGSEVAREASDLVISDDSFISITEGVRAGRRIFSNLRKAASYIIAIHIPIFGMALVPIASPLWPLVLLPIQIAILEIVIDPSASLAYEAEKPGKEQMLRPPRPTGEKLVTKEVLRLAALQGVILFFGSLGSFLFSLSIGSSEEKVRSITFGTILLGNLLLMISNRSGTTSVLGLIIGRTNRLAGVIFVFGILSMAVMFTIEPIRSAFSLSPVNFFDLSLIVIFATPAVIWFEIHKLLLRKQRSRIETRVSAS